MADGIGLQTDAVCAAAGEYEFMSDWTAGGAWPRALGLGMLAFGVYPALQLAGGADAGQAVPAVVVIIVLGTYAWLCWRQPAPGRGLRAMLAGMAAVAAAVPLVWGPDWLGLLIYPAVAAALLAGRDGLLCAVCLGAAAAAIGLGTGADHAAVLSISLVTVLAGLAAAGVAGLTRLTGALRVAQGEVARLAAQEERLRLARDLHDAVKQQLFVASLELGAGRASLGAGDEAACAHLEQAELAVREARAGLAGLIGDRRPAMMPAQASPAGAGLVSSLRQVVSQWERRHPITVRLRVSGTVSCPPDVQEAMLWAAQEALTNAARHSGASAVSVQVESAGAAVSVRVADDGTGFTTGSAGAGHGLAIMAERVQRVGGQATVSSDGSGTTVTLTWPAPATGPGQR